MFFRSFIHSCIQQVGNNWKVCLPSVMSREKLKYYNHICQLDCWKQIPIGLLQVGLSQACRWWLFCLSGFATSTLKLHMEYSRSRKKKKTWETSRKQREEAPTITLPAMKNSASFQCSFFFPVCLPWGWNLAGYSFKQLLCSLYQNEKSGEGDSFFYFLTGSRR